MGLEDRLVHRERGQVMDGCSRPGMMGHVLQVFARLVQICPPAGHSELKQRPMLRRPPGTGLGVREVEQRALSWPEVKRVHRAVRVLRQIPPGQRLRIVATFHGEVRLLNHEQVKPLLFELGNHALWVRPVKRLER